MKIDLNKLMEPKSRKKSYSIYLEEDLVIKVMQITDNAPLSHVVTKIFQQITSSVQEASHD